jgi:hypothetical protein
MREPAVWLKVRPADPRPIRRNYAQPERRQRFISDEQRFET